MPVQKIKSGRIITVQAETYIGDKGTIFYDEYTPELRLSDGTTPGGILFTSGGGGTGTYVLVTATNVRLGGIKVGSGLSITGDGTLSAIATSTYVLPIANTTTLGGIKVGSGLSINGLGILSATVTSTYVLNTATSTTLGGIKIGAGLVASPDGTVSAVSTSSYTLPIASTTTLGGIKVGTNLSISPDGTLNANTSTAGVSDSFKTIKVNSQTDLVAVGADTIEFKAGNGILIETSATSSPYKSLTITSMGFGNVDGGMFDTVFDTTTLMFDGGTP
jgi:hypothetical protein